MTALARGAACNVDLSDGWDVGPFLALPLEEIRARLQVTPLTADSAGPRRSVA